MLAIGVYLNEPVDEMLLAPLALGMPVGLLPLQLLWLNLVTDGLLGLGLGVEPAEKGTMHRPPRDPRAWIFSKGVGTHVLWVGALIGAVALLAGWLTLDHFFDVVPLSSTELLLAALLGSVAFWAIEIEKWFLRRQTG